MLKNAKSDEERKLGPNVPSDAEIFAKLLDDVGGKKLVSQVLDHKRQSEEATANLRRLGFVLGDRGRIEMAYDAPESVWTAYHKARHIDTQPTKSLNKFDVAIAKVLTAKSAESACEIAEPLLAQ